MKDLDEHLEKLYRGEMLEEAVMISICEKLKEVLMEESNVHKVSAPVTVVGDVHGQLYDVLEIFRTVGTAPSVNYLFLGDYVDRGYFSVEVISLLFALKLRYPQRITMLRGNHESRNVTQVYGFYAECVRKCSAKLWHAVCDVFDFLTIAAVIDDSILCVHGGLSPSVHTLDQIRTIERFQEVPHEGAFADILWSDPESDPARGGWVPSNRGAGYCFGAEVVDHFVHVNSIDHILRAHQLCMEGYQVLFDDKLSTVWSAPNYCYRCGNKASVLNVSETLERTFQMFDAAPEDERLAPGDPKSKQAKPRGALAFF